MNQETWKAIPGYEGYYEASTKGNIRNLKGKIMKFEDNKDKALYVVLSKDGQRQKYTAHRLIMLTFKGERPEGYDICHENGDYKDNRLENLRYDTPSQNRIDNYRYGGKIGGGKLSIKQVLEIRRLYAKGDYTQKELGIRFGVAKSHISSIVNRRYFSWLKDDGTIEESNTKVS